MTEPLHTSPESRLRVVIVGGGVAALEAAFALQAIAGDRVFTRVLSPEDTFVDRPRTIGVPFNRGFPEHYPLAPLAAAAGAELVRAEVVEVNPERRVAIGADAEEHPYDALIVATGATALPRFAHATTIDAVRMDEVLHGLVMDIEQDYVRRLAVLLPAPISWPLPAYEVALMASERAWDMQAKTEIVLITPERSPLEMFGEKASEQLAQLLAERGIEVITSAIADVPTNRTVVAHPSGRVIDADRIVALPELRGPRIPGLPADGGGFLPVNRTGRVRGVEGVWAAGDVTDFPIKQGGVAAGLADVIATDVASVAGLPVSAEAFSPSLRAVLLTGGRPRYLYRDPKGGESRFSETALDGLEDKVYARYLTPHLHALRADRATDGDKHAQPLRSVITRRR